MTYFSWDVEPEEVFTQFTDRYVEEIHQAVLALAERYAPEIEAWMKSKAPWQDQTGNARQSLSSEVFELANGVVIAFGHGVDYGIFLETMQAGRFSIIGPALDYFSAKIWVDVQRLMS